MTLYSVQLHHNQDYHTCIACLMYGYELLSFVDKDQITHQPSMHRMDTV